MKLRKNKEFINNKNEEKKRIEEVEIEFSLKYLIIVLVALLVLKLSYFVWHNYDDAIRTYKKVEVEKEAYFSIPEVVKIENNKNIGTSPEFIETKWVSIPSFSDKEVEDIIYSDFSTLSIIEDLSLGLLRIGGNKISGALDRETAEVVFTDNTSVIVKNLRKEYMQRTVEIARKAINKENPEIKEEISDFEAIEYLLLKTPPQKENFIEWIKYWNSKQKEYDKTLMKLKLTVCNNELPSILVPEKIYVREDNVNIIQFRENGDYFDNKEDCLYFMVFKNGKCYCMLSFQFFGRNLTQEEVDYLIKNLM